MKFYYQVQCQSLFMMQDLSILFVILFFIYFLLLTGAQEKNEQIQSNKSKLLHHVKLAKIK